MKFRWKRLIVTGAVVGLISIAFATSGLNLSGHSSIPSFARPTLAQGQNAAPKPQLSEEAFKNIQILKGIPVDEFMGTMGLFSPSLSSFGGDFHTAAGGPNPTWEPD